MQTPRIIVKNKRITHRRWSDLADTSFLCNWSYFVDVRKRVGKFLPAGLKNRALGRRNELIHLRLSHRCIFVMTPAEIFFKKKGGSKPSVLALISSLSVHVHSPLIELKDELSSWRRALTARGSTRPLRQIDTHELFRLTSFLRRFRAQTCTFATEIEVKNGLCLN